MIIDGNDFDPALLPAYELVVVGTGIAGQTLLQVLFPAGFRVAVIESGSYEPIASVDALKRVQPPITASLMTPASAVWGAPRTPGVGGASSWTRLTSTHGIDNLYISGSSLFPTTGWANPTMTIVALTIRQAEHLRDQLAMNDR